MPAVEACDAILLGSLIWNTQPHMVMLTFLDEIGLSGKTIHRFVTNAISGMGSTVDDCARLCPGAKIGECLTRGCSAPVY